VAVSLLSGNSMSGAKSARDFCSTVGQSGFYGQSSFLLRAFLYGCGIQSILLRVLTIALSVSFVPITGYVRFIAY
jgi:hypothetical protein